jgi:hypothetical protein
VQDDNFVRRDANLEEHKKTVAEKNVKMANFFLNPEIKTHAKSEVDKEIRIAKLSQKMDQVEQLRA